MLRPFVSVVVATRNRAALLGRTLAALAGQDWPPASREVLVVDNGSTDDTAGVVALAAERAMPDAVRYLHVAAPGKSRAVNAGLREARGDIIAFTDDDVAPTPGWLTALVRPFDAPAIDFVAGRTLPDWEAAPPHWMSPALFGALAIADGGSSPLAIRRGTNEHVMPIGANMAVRASVIGRLGGLRTDLGKLEGTLRTGEDHEFFLRLLHAGCGGVYEPAAVVAHRVPCDRVRRAYFRRWLFQNGQDVARLERAYPKSGRMLLAVPGYRWRDGAAAARSAVAATAAGDAAKRFAALIRLIWLAGYMRASWFGGAGGETADLPIVERMTTG